MKLTDPIFQDAETAREWLETQRWPDGPICPHCGNSDQDKITILKGKAHRPGLYKCNECRRQFTVMVGTVMERSHIPLNLWAMAMFIMASAKKGVSARQMARMMGVPLKTSWFLAHRIREAMKETSPGPLGGPDRAVEADETFFGGKAENRAYKPPPKKQAVLALVERDGKTRSFHIANVTARMIKPLIYQTIDRASFLMTDELVTYLAVGKQFAGHGTVTHGKGEYTRSPEGIRAPFFHTNTVECFFSLCKRAVFGAHHSISEAHLHRYLVEWDFKFNNRRVSDGERTALIAQQAEGKRLMYQRPAKAPHGAAAR
jgi:transposase-like protein